MPAAFNEIINSRVFKFVVGEEADGQSSEISIHEDAVSQLSDSLYSLTKGTSPEARAGRAVWKDVSKETFERFAQFAYTGDYSIPHPESRAAAVHTPPASPHVQNGTRRRNGSEASASTTEPFERSTSVFDSELSREPLPEKIDDDSGTILNYPGPIKKNRKKKKNKANNQIAATESEQTAEPVPQPDSEQASSQPADSGNPQPNTADSEVMTSEKVELESVEPNSKTAAPETLEQHTEGLSQMLAVDFYQLSFPIVAKRDNYHGTCEPASDFDKDKSYSRILLCHASLHALGEFQLIDSLKALALFKLHKTLCAFKLDRENIGDITDLAKYAYSDKSNPQHKEEGSGGLRVLVCQYLAMYKVELSRDARFMNLLAGGGQIVKDFFQVSFANATAEKGKGY